jgi:hypothetical protein
MVDLFFIIIIVVALGLLGGLLYLINLPFKKRLQKSGKLTDKLNRKINWVFVIIPCVIGILLYSFKDYRTPSKDRLEKISDIKLPTDFKVIKDEYHDMWQDYCILYDIQLTNSSTTDLIKRIKHSRFYNSNSFHSGAWTENDFILADSTKAVWSKSIYGFDFTRQEGLTSYSIQIDTMKNTLKYNECAD